VQGLGGEVELNRVTEPIAQDIDQAQVADDVPVEGPLPDLRKLLLQTGDPPLVKEHVHRAVELLAALPPQLLHGLEVRGGEVLRIGAQREVREAEVGCVRPIGEGETQLLGASGRTEQLNAH